MTPPPSRGSSDTSPVFVFDSREKWFPVAVEESLRIVLGHDPPWRAGPLNFPPDMRQPDLPPVGYCRVVAGGGLFWVQHWLWYLYNPGPPILYGVGRHEGDWEFVQVAHADVELTRPVLVTGSQHHTGGKREAWACELTPTEKRPKIYVALGSHANFFAPGTQGDGTDRCDGHGQILSEVEWRPFGAWASWPGRWGNSTGEGKSPQSPGNQGVRWKAPHLYHSSSKG